MIVDERYVARWRQERANRSQQARERWMFSRQSRLAAMSLAFQPKDGGSSLDNVDSRYKPLWQRARTEKWRAHEDDLSHEAYLAWWRDNGGDEEGSLAHRVEKHMVMLGKRGMLRGRNLVQVCDLLLSSLGPLLAAEGFRRWLAGHVARTSPNDP